MLNPKDSYELNQIASPYANVIAISKRARQISEEAMENHEIMTDKSLKVAIAEFVENKYKVDPIVTEDD